MIPPFDTPITDVPVVDLGLTKDSKADRWVKKIEDVKIRRMQW